MFQMNAWFIPITILNVIAAVQLTPQYGSYYPTKSSYLGYTHSYIDSGTGSIFR